MSARRKKVALAPPGAQPPDLDIEKPQRRAGYAVVGLGELSIDEILPAFARSKRSRLAALVSGHPKKARALARLHGLDDDRVLGYDALHRLRDFDDVDIVYVVLPNTMHAEATIAALEAGKHVLCEKPMAPTVAECERMIAAARAAKRELMIAYRLHHEPFTRTMIELVRSGAIGRVKTIASSNCQVTKPPNIRLSAELGGGPLGDTGIYCINGFRMITGEEPSDVTAMFHRPLKAAFAEVEESWAFTLRYPSGVLAHGDTSFGAAPSRYLRVHGDRGWVHLENAFAYRGQRLTLRREASDHGVPSTEEIAITPVDHFAAEMDGCAEVVLDGATSHTTGAMGLADVRILEQLRAAAGG